MPKRAMNIYRKEGEYNILSIGLTNLSKNNLILPNSN